MPSHVFGLDISDHSIELVSLVGKNSRIVVDKLVRAELPVGIVTGGLITDATTLASVIKGICQAAFGRQPGQLHAGVSLPENLIYSKVFTLPANLSREFAGKAVAIEAANIFPISMVGVDSDFVVMTKNNVDQDVFYAVIEHGAVESCREVLKTAGVKPLFFDSEAAALARSLVLPASVEATLLVDIGSTLTLLAVVDRGGVRHSTAMPAGGEMLTSHLETRLNVSFSEAEKLKKEVGFDPMNGNGRTFFVLQSATTEIVNEVREVIKYYKEKSGRNISAIILAGGTSLTPKIVDYVATNFPDIRVSLGDPFADVAVTGGMAPTGGILYATAMGLALRASSNRAGPGINFLPHDKPGGRLAGLTQNRLGDAILNFFSTMTTRAKRTPSKKKIPASPKKDGGKTSAVFPPASSSPSVQEPEFGQSAGDILDSVGGGAKKTAEMPAAEAPSAMPPPSVPIVVTAGGGEVEANALTTPAETGRRTPRLFIIGGIVLALTLLAAAGGVYMFAKKNNAADFFGLFGERKSAVTSRTQAPEAAPEDAMSSIAASFIADVNSQSAGEITTIPARIAETEGKLADNFASTGQTASTETKSTGAVTIVNRTGKPYTFVATTRLLSEDGILFRLKTATAISANGAVNAEVAADVAGPSGDIGPTTFVFPGLSSSLQKDVFARSEAAMTGGSGSVAVVTEDDIERAKTSIAARLAQTAKDDLAAMLVSGEKLIDDLINTVEVSAVAPKPGAVGSSFSVTLTLRFRALLVSEKDIAEFLQNALRAELQSGEDPADYEFGSALYTVEAYDVAAGKAQIRVEAPYGKRT